MITDDTIDITTAKCWCIFSEPEFKKYMAQEKQEVDEGFIDALNKFNGVFGPIMTTIGIASFFGPYLVNTLKKIRYSKDESIAKASFEADGSKYNANFNIKSMKWILTTDDVKVDTNDVVSFFRTKFFDTFVQSCAKYIAPVLKNEKQILANIKQIEDNNSKKFIKSFFKYKDRIVQNMLEKKYIT